MEDKNYLNEEEQFKKILNKNEISRIKDPILQEIRLKYWTLRYKAVLDTQNNTDSQLEELMDDIDKSEQEALSKYKKN